MKRSVAFSRVSVNTADLPDAEDEPVNAKKRQVIIDAEVSEAASTVLEKLMAGGETGMLEGETREKAEAFVNAARAASEVLKEMEARDLAAIDYAEALRRQHDVFTENMRTVYQGTLADATLSSVALTLQRYLNATQKIALPRPPAYVGRVPITGKMSNVFRAQLRSDFRTVLGNDEWTADESGELVLYANDVQTTDSTASYTGTIPGGCLQKPLAHKYGRENLPNTADGTGQNTKFYVMFVPLAAQRWRLVFQTVEAGAQERVGGIDPNLSALFQAGTPSDGRYIAMASGAVSGGVTGPNQLVNLMQGLSSVSMNIQLIPLLVFMVLKLLSAKFRRFARQHFGNAGWTLASPKLAPSFMKKWARTAGGKLCECSRS